MEMIATVMTAGVVGLLGLLFVMAVKPQEQKIRIRTEDRKPR